MAFDIIIKKNTMELPSVRPRQRYSRVGFPFGFYERRETNGVEEETKDGRACCSPPKAFSSSSFRSNSRQSLLTNCGNRFRPFLDRDVWKGKAPLLLLRTKNKKSARPLNVAIFIKRLTPRRTSPTTTNKLCQPQSPFFLTFVTRHQPLRLYRRQRYKYGREKEKKKERERKQAFENVCGAAKFVIPFLPELPARHKLLKNTHMF